MKLLIITTLMLAFAPFARAEFSITFRDSSGRQTGTATTNGSGVTTLREVLEGKPAPRPRTATVSPPSGIVLEGRPAQPRGAERREANFGKRCNRGRTIQSLVAKYVAEVEKSIADAEQHLNVPRGTISIHSERP